MYTYSTRIYIKLSHGGIGWEIRIAFISTWGGQIGIIYKLGWVVLGKGLLLFLINFDRDLTRNLYK